MISVMYLQFRVDNWYKYFNNILWNSKRGGMYEQCTNYEMMYTNKLMTWFLKSY